MKAIFIFSIDRQPTHDLVTRLSAKQQYVGKPRYIAGQSGRGVLYNDSARLKMGGML